jgi:hypothetical protein
VGGTNDISGFTITAEVVYDTDDAFLPTGTPLTV